MAPASPVRSAMIADLTRSGLQGSTRYLGVEPLSPTDLQALIPGSPRVQAYQIPYYDWDGNKTEFFRVRYLEDPRDVLRRIMDSKQRRYTQPKGKPPQLYIPPLLEWFKIRRDPATPVYITEGEKKAACACLHGLACLGLGGVWNWRAKKEGQVCIPQLEEVTWDKRLVYIVFDSDAARNPMVMAAERALATQLTRMGAVVNIVRLQDDKGKKVGLDDYLVAGGEPKRLQCLSYHWSASYALHRLNTEVACILSPFHFLRLHDPSRPMNTHSFLTAFATQNYTEVVHTEKGSKITKREPAKEWLEWPHRATFERVTYRPGQPQVTGQELNIWPGWGAGADDPQPGNVTPFVELLDFICAKEPQHRKWLEQWLAYPIQYPGTKLYTAVLIWGIQGGTGKSLLGETMRLVYGDNWTMIDNLELDSQFNAWAPRRQFVLGDEITGRDTEAYADKLKGMITRPFVTINEKNVPHYRIPDCLNYFLTSNHPASFSIRDRERRYFVAEVVGAPLPDEFYARYRAWMWENKQEQRINTASASALMWHLLHVDLEGFSPDARAPSTLAAQEMVQTGKSDLTVWAETLRDAPETLLRVNGVLPRSLWTASELLQVAKLSVPRVALSGVSRALKLAGVPMAHQGQPIRTVHGSQRLYVMFNRTKLASAPPAEVARVFEQERPLLDRRVKDAM